MATIKFEIDTESDDFDGGGRGLRPRAAIKVGLLASIKLADELVAAFETGLGTEADKHLESGYKEIDIKDKKDRIKVNRNEVFATVGGRVVLEALKNESAAGTPPYVSLVGSLPTGDLGNSCRGGILLESFKRNKERRDYLKDLAAAHTDNTIYLLANANSGMYGEERDDWGNNATHKASYAGVAGGENKPERIAWDFEGDGANPPKVEGATAVIISDDPFFQANRFELITKANAWLDANPQRHIVYPSKIYEKAKQGNTIVTAKSGQSTLFGHDLLSAYQLLGVLANRLFYDKGLNFGFVRLVDAPPRRVP